MRNDPGVWKRREALCAGALLLLPLAASAAVSTFRQQLITQSSVSTPESNDGFGQALAVGDFDGDNYPDLAVGAPGETFGGVTSSGVVSIYYGGSGGLGGVQGIVQGSGTVPGTLGTYNFFGRVLAAGDFDDDGRDDLAIDSWDDAGGQSQAGTVTVLYGAPGGLGDLGGGQLWSQAVTGVPGAPGVQEFFGDALATGDFDGNGFADLAIGTPRDDGSAGISGSVTVLYGGAAGLSVTGVDFFTGDTLGCSAAQADEAFGGALAAGDFNADGEADLAIGVPGESSFPGGQSVSSAGMVHVVPGSATGLLAANALCLYPGAAIAGGVVPGERQPGGRFGAALGAANFDRVVLIGKIHDDLAIGNPGIFLGGTGGAGEVVVLPGSAGGITASGSFRFDRSDIAGTPPSGVMQQFGRGLAVGRATGNASSDLFVHWRPGGWTSLQNGSVIVPGTSSGLALARAEPLDSSQAQLLVAPGEGDDQFGIAVGVGDFDRDGFSDLALGDPGKDLGLMSNAGVVLVLRGALFTDNFETGDARFWSALAP